MKIKNFGVPDIFCNDEKFHAIIISKQLLVLEQVLTRLNNKYIPNFLFFYREYISRAGGKISPETRLEISPLLSYAGEHLNEKAAGQIFDQPTVILN